MGPTGVRALLGIVALTTVVGCSETGISQGSWHVDPPNPPDLEVDVHTDRIVQTPVPAVDVLWVIDNSCSMDEEQRALGQNFGAFINYFVGSGLDYHVGVLSTGFEDPSDRGKLREADGYRWIDEDVRDATGVFRDMAEMGTNGPATERGRDQVYGAIELLSDSPANEGFYREEAALAVIVISDEDDASSVKTVPEFIDWYVDLKTERSRISFSSIVGPDGGCESRNGKAVAGKDYLRITREVGGIEWPICDDNWSQVLEDLGIQVAGLQREFFLSSVPVESSIEVSILEQDATEAESFVEGVDWTYSRSRNSVKFNTYVPTPYAEVFIDYLPLSESNAADGDDLGQ